MRLIAYVASLILMFFLGAFTGHRGIFPKSTPTASGRHPAYLIASWDVLHPEKLKPFDDTVIPLARKAGMEILTSSKPEDLEGPWPYKGSLVVERYDSMQALLKYWRSPENLAAQKLREGVVNSEFIVAVDTLAVPPEQH